MNQLVESLKRLYSNKKVTEDKIIKMYQNGTINEQEKNYILKEGGNNVHNINK